MSSLLAGVVGQGIHVVFGNTTAREFLVFRSLAVTNARQQIGGLYDTTDKCVDSLNRPQNEAGSCRPPRPAGQPTYELLFRPQAGPEHSARIPALRPAL